MRRTIEIFDAPSLRRMADAVAAAVATARLSGTPPTAEAQHAMARRVIEEAARGSTGRLALTEAALDGTWS
jgi:hypothetical protein